MTCVKVTAIGNSPAIILPPEVVGRLRLAKGDTLEIRETSAGIELAPCVPDFTRQMEAAEAVMRDNRRVLKKLAE